MKKFSVLLSAAAFMAVTACAGSQTTATKSDNKPGAMAISSATIKGTIESINYKTRVAVLKTTEGKTITKKIESDVTNIEQFKKGDIVTAQFVESVAVDIRTHDLSGKKADINEYSYVDVKTNEKVPYKLKAKVIEAKAVVTEINHAKRFITIKGPKGKAQSFLVDKTVANFDKIKKNDEIIVTYTESVTFTVEKIK